MVFHLLYPELDLGTALRENDYFSPHFFGLQHFCPLTVVHYSGQHACAIQLGLASAQSAVSLTYGVLWKTRLHPSLLFILLCYCSVLKRLNRGVPDPKEHILAVDGNTV